MTASAPQQAPSGPSGGTGLKAGLSPVEQVLGAMLVAALAAGAVVWATAHLSALVFSGARPDLGLADASAAAYRLVHEPGDPPAAFDEHVASRIPGPVPFWTTFVVVAGLPVALLSAVVARRSREKKGQELPDARWAKANDLVTLVVKRPEAGRLTLGWGPGERLLACEPGHSLLVLGPTQSGKTSGLAIPAILEWDGPVIATSVKTDLLEHTLDARRRRGEAWVYDPTISVPSIERASWSPLAGCRTWQGALRTASWLAEAGREGNLSESDFWYTSAAKLLAPLLFAAAYAQLSIEDVVRWVDRQDQAEVELHLQLAGVRQAIDAAAATWKREDRMKSSVYATAETVLRAFADPQVAASAMTSAIEPDALLDGSNTLYISAPLHEQARLRPLFTTLVQTMLHGAYQRAAERGRIEPRLLLVLDEAANIAPLPDLAHVASTAAGLGIQLVTVWQDRAQIVARYGNGASTVMNNHRAKLVLSGIADQTTTADIAEAIGETEVVRRSTTVDPEGRTSATDASHRRLLTSGAALRQLRPFEGVLVYGHLPPARLRLRPWFQASRYLPRCSNRNAAVTPPQPLPADDRPRPARTSQRW